MSDFKVIDTDVYFNEMKSLVDKIFDIEGDKLEEYIEKSRANNKKVNFRSALLESEHSVLVTTMEVTELIQQWVRDTLMKNRERLIKGV